MDLKMDVFLLYTVLRRELEKWIGLKKEQKMRHNIVVAQYGHSVVGCFLVGARGLTALGLTKSALPPDGTPPCRDEGT